MPYGIWIHPAEVIVWPSNHRATSIAIRALCTRWLQCPVSAAWIGDAISPRRHSTRVRHWPDWPSCAAAAHGRIAAGPVRRMPVTRFRRQTNNGTNEQKDKQKDRNRVNPRFCGRDHNSNSTTSICCRFIVQLIVQLIHNKSTTNRSSAVWAYQNIRNKCGTFNLWEPWIRPCHYHKFHGGEVFHRVSRGAQGGMAWYSRV